MNLRKNALKILEETSRTFYIPISRLPDGLLEAVASAYLCMRAIDEIEDHPTLENSQKSHLLREMSLKLQTGTVDSTIADFTPDFSTYQGIDEVSLRIGEWAMLAPSSIAPRIWDATASMADRMAHWAEINWKVSTKSDLDAYTFSVAGAVGLMLSDLWAWYDGTKTDRSQAIGFGRGLQAVNILRNHREDLKRGVEFYPQGWTDQEMQNFARDNLKLADSYTFALPEGPALEFCKIPLALAHGTLDALLAGREKLSRLEVIALVDQVTKRRKLALSKNN